MNRRMLLPIVATAAAGMLALTACSSSGGSSPAPSTPMIMSTSTGSTTQAAAGQHNQSDVTFATDMIPHHQQAVQMAEMAAERASNTQVKSLAAAIKKAQDPEISSMTGWLKIWNAPDPSMSGMNMGGTGNSDAMMSDAEMATLTKATGAAFDRMWVTMMITHHQGAVAMAKTQLANGRYPAARQLARSIVTSQNAEIQQLQTLLMHLPTS